MNGSTTPRLAAPATAASTALPPSIKQRNPDSEARPWAEATTPRVPQAAGRQAPPWGVVGAAIAMICSFSAPEGPRPPFLGVPVNPPGMGWGAGADRGLTHFGWSDPAR